MGVNILSLLTFSHFPKSPPQLLTHYYPLLFLFLFFSSSSSILYLNVSPLPLSFSPSLFLPFLSFFSLSSIHNFPLFSLSPQFLSFPFLSFTSNPLFSCTLLHLNFSLFLSLSSPQFLSSSFPSFTSTSSFSSFLFLRLCFPLLPLSPSPPTFPSALLQLNLTPSFTHPNSP